MQRDPITNSPDDLSVMPKLFVSDYFLTPGECNPEQRMPLTLLINRLIEVATLHANELGIGYAYLQREHQTWVLSRVAVEMKRYPGVNENYRITTWVSSVSRLFSERDFEITVGDEVVGYARTVWAVIDTRTRTVGDISRLSWISGVVPQKECPVPKPARLRPIAAPQPGEEVPQGYHQTAYRFQYTDIDFNRHVNSSRYIDLLLNQWSLEFHDANRLNRFEIAYIHEARFGLEATLRMLDFEENGAPSTSAELVDSEGHPLLRALLRFTPR